MGAHILLPRISILYVLFFLYKNIAKNEENLVEENDEEHYNENDEENDENLWLYNRPKLQIFEAFVTVIEISIFGFENSTLYKCSILVRGVHG